MSQRVEGPRKSFRTAAAIGAHLRVKHSAAGVVAVAGVGDRDFGTTDVATLAADEDVAVNLMTAEGTLKMVAAAAISAGAFCYQAASGKITSSGVGLVGIALEAAGADGDIIEVMPLPTGGTSGVRVVSGAAALVSGVLAVSTGLTTIVGAAANLNVATPPGSGLDPSALGVTFSGGTLTITAWKVTSNSNPTLIASTATTSVTYVAVGF